MADFNMWSPSQKEYLEYAKIYNENLEKRVDDIMNMLTQNQRILDNIRSSGLLSTSATLHPNNPRHEDLDRASLYPPFLRTPLVEGGRIVTPGYHTRSYDRSGVHGDGFPMNPYRHGGVHGKEPITGHPANINDYDMI